MDWLNRVLRLWVAIALILVPSSPALADLRTPAWYDQNAVTTAPDWHFRVPVIVPAGASVNSTIVVDVDFTALLSTMGVSGTFDANSPRIVRSTGALATTQEFTDAIYAGATDTIGNGRGEVRFLLQDAGATTYYIYFDVTQNGAKPANPQAPINGNFEVGSAGTAAPSGWVAPTVTAGIDAQMRGAETVSVTGNPAPVDGVNPRNTDGNPNTGSFSYLMGNRSSAAGGITGNPGVTFYRTITVPATAPGSITVRYRPEGWDTGDFDPVRIDLTNAAGTAVLVEMVGPTAGSYPTKPFAPNVVNAQASNTTSGYRQYNGFDCTLTGTHLQGMTVGCHAEPWFTVTQSLAAYAGQTIRFRVRSFSDAADKTWVHIDDVEWSRVNATLGAPQAFGVNITAPAAGGNYTPGQGMTVTVQVDANPTAATTPMTAAIFNPSGTQISPTFQLFNDGTNGDAVAGDAIWTSDQAIASPPVSVPLTATNGSNYVLRVFGRDGTSSTIGAQNGLARGPGSGAAAETQANFWNIDEILFNVQTASLSFSKTSVVLSDPVNGATNPKMIPGATVQYCLLVTNAGPAAATSIVMSDAIPAGTVFIPGSMRSGTSCATAATVEDDNAAGADENDPDGASYATGNLIAVRANLTASTTVAITFNVTIQ